MPSLPGSEDTFMSPYLLLDRQPIKSVLRASVTPITNSSSVDPRGIFFFNDFFKWFRGVCQALSKWYFPLQTYTCIHTYTNVILLVSCLFSLDS